MDPAKWLDMVASAFEGREPTCPVCPGCGKEMAPNRSGTLYCCLGCLSEPDDKGFQSALYVIHVPSEVPK